MKQSKIITAAQAAKLLNLSRSTFQRRIADGEYIPIDPVNPNLRRQKLRFYEADIRGA